MKNEEYVIVNGEKMSVTDYKKMVAEKQKTRRGKKRFLKKEQPKKKKEKEVTEIKAIALEIENMLKPISALKSIQVYNSHAYRSWGKVGNEILLHIRKPMASYAVKFGEVNSIVSDILKIAKTNEKAIFQYIEKLSWKLEDLNNDIKDIMKATEQSGVCERYKNHEAIYGQGRQLGLATVVVKSLNAISEVEKTIKELQQIGKKGVDPFEVGEHMSIKARRRCWA